MPLLRIDRILVSSGAYSRREAAELIKRGAVCAGGMPVVSASDKYDPEKTEITVSGEILDCREKRYVMMHKPAGFVSSTDDPREKTVTELLDARLKKIGLFPAGRLDKDAEGLLILTNDGDYAHRVMSPKSGVMKVYYAKVDGHLVPADEKAFGEGICLRDGTHCLPAKLEILSESDAFVTVQEGKYHQVKRMLASLGKPVVYLKRVSIGALTLDKELPAGAWRDMTETEMRAVFEAPEHEQYYDNR